MQETSRVTTAGVQAAYIGRQGVKTGFVFRDDARTGAMASKQHINVLITGGEKPGSETRSRLQNYVHLVDQVNLGVRTVFLAASIWKLAYTARLFGSCADRNVHQFS